MSGEYSIGLTISSVTLWPFPASYVSFLHSFNDILVGDEYFVAACVKIALRAEFDNAHFLFWPYFRRLIIV
jgi:hypothetical protein